MHTELYLLTSGYHCKNEKACDFQAAIDSLVETELRCQGGDDDDSGSIDTKANVGSKLNGD